MKPWTCVHKHFFAENNSWNYFQPNLMNFRLFTHIKLWPLSYKNCVYTLFHAFLKMSQGFIRLLQAWYRAHDRHHERHICILCPHVHPAATPDWVTVCTTSVKKREIRSSLLYMYSMQYNFIIMVIEHKLYNQSSFTCTCSKKSHTAELWDRYT